VPPGVTTALPDSPAHPTGRSAAVATLCTLEEHRFELHADETLFAYCDQCALPERERGFAHEIVFGCLRHKTWLEKLIARKSAVLIKDMDPGLRWILATAVFQMTFLERVPVFAAVNEAVALAAARGGRKWTGFANAVLRGLVREALLEQPRPGDGRLEDVYSHPAWLVARLVRQFGAERAAAILAWNNTRPGLYAYVTGPRDSAINALTAAGVAGESAFGAKILQVLEPKEFLHSSCFAQGRLYVMDPWSVAVAQRVPVGPGCRVLDMCAAPGGKTIVMADRAEVSITACDHAAARLETLRGNIARCHARNVEVRAVDGRDASREFGQGAFDAVLLDAPCANTGVIRRKPEVRWRLRPDDIRRHAAAQKKLLSSAVACARAGGHVVYAVCSIMPEESTGVVDACVATGAAVCVEQWLTLPGAEGTDGGFCALLRTRG